MSIKINKYKKQEIAQLSKAIYNLHGCESKFVEPVPIKEMFQCQVVWEGIVQIFDLIDHPTAKKCYAWSHAVEGSSKRSFYVVLHQGLVNSPEKAVRAAIVADNKKT